MKDMKTLQEQIDRRRGLITKLRNRRFGNKEYQEGVDALFSENNFLYEQIEMAMNELGVPGPGYPQPVANAWEILNLAMKERRPQP